jgi:hypothetical protein
MSDSSLSPPPMSEPSLPTLPQTPFVQPLGLQYRKKRLELPGAESVLFTASLFSRTLLETSPATVQLRCLQPGCSYTPKAQPLSYKQTSNYWTHYQHSHIELFEKFNPKNKASSNSQASSSHASDITTLFTPRLSNPKASNVEAFQAKYRALLLDFIVSNNLALRVVDSTSIRRLIQHCNPSLLTISSTTLSRDLDRTFQVAQTSLKLELQEHIKAGGRISITTDAWGARNYKEFIAITGHWISKDWTQRSQLLDVVHLIVGLYIF